MNFILGFFSGLVAASGIVVFVIYWLCSRSNNIAVAKFVNGIAHALAHKPKTPPLAVHVQPSEENGGDTNAA